MQPVVHLHRTIASQQYLHILPEKYISWDAKWKEDPYQIRSYAYRIINSSRWDYTHSVVELLKAADGYRLITARIDGWPRRSIKDRSRIDVSFNNNRVIVYWNNCGFVFFEPSEQRRGLNDFDMFMEVARKTIARSPDQVITAFRMLPNVIGLQR